MVVRGGLKQGRKRVCGCDRGKMRVFDRLEFEASLSQGICGIQTSGKEIEYMSSKGEDICDLFEELDQKDLLRSISKDKAIELNESFVNSLKNFMEIRNLMLTIQNLTQIAERTSIDTIRIRDSKAGVIEFNTKQLAIMWGITYASLCEIIKEYLISVIDFKKVCGSNPSGIGQLITKLKKYGVKNLNYFKDIDPNVRNAFFHLDFKIDGDKIYCKNNPSIYSEEGFMVDKRRTKDYIYVYDLLQLLLKSDRSTYPLMGISLYLLKKHGLKL